MNKLKNIEKNIYNFRVSFLYTLTAHVPAWLPGHGGGGYPRAHAGRVMGSTAEKNKKAPRIEPRGIVYFIILL